MSAAERREGADAAGRVALVLAGIYGGSWLYAAGLSIGYEIGAWLR